jgi:uncharacterized protein (TIGR03437 family)
MRLPSTLLSQAALGVCLFALLAPASATAQDAVSSIRIYTEPSGARFQVDGQTYVNSQTFLWPQGSKHLLQFLQSTFPDGTYQLSLDASAKYTFSGWVDNANNMVSLDPFQTITASPSVTSLKATLKVFYRVTLRFSAAPVGAGACGAPGDAPQDGVRTGLVYVDTTCFGSDADIYLEPGVHKLNAFPYPGSVFVGWSVNGSLNNQYLASFTVSAPMNVAPVFQAAKRVRFITDPPGMQVLVDRTPTPTSVVGSPSGSLGSATCPINLSLSQGAPVTVPGLCFGDFDFLPGSKHVIGAPSPQYDANGKLWVFDSFSNGIGQNELYVADTNTVTADLVVAKFAPAVQAAFLTSPPGLKLQIDGRDNWQTYNFVWGGGTKHTVVAPASQTDASGRRWTFQSWSNGGAATQDIIADVNQPSVRYTAVYTGMGQLKLTTNPPGIKLQVDGADCLTPCSVDRAPGSQIAIVAPQSVPVSDGVRMDFLGWGDGGASARTLTLGNESKSIFANYGNSYRVVTASDPDGGVDFRFDPPSPDLFYPTDTQVSVTAQARPGFKFRRWGGDLAGVYNVGQLTVSGPRTVIAMLDRVPYIAPAGVRNAAGATPDGTVAPGSIISIFGESLAPRIAVSTRNPLDQTLADVVVTVGDRILPLLFVSPEQINAQILSDLPDGQYTLRVRWTGQPDVTAAFTISRNAPGLFAQVVDGKSYAIAYHDDGSLISPDSPARHGETVTVFGTGFGPYTDKVIDGFLLPTPCNLQLADSLQVVAGATTLQPGWTGGAAGMVGANVTRFVITDDLPGSSTLDLTVSVNGKASNPVLLPVQ